ncbi:hypothetical protein U0C82_11085 [Fulvimarina sp. 2208YS6-2-32]|uniref:Uncharacterized protein n=1 Tax=Fulvimarina uroteuthidis TaxID=3098149 RepID=A0ABU5I2T1_9HYPH|nr:hypothetical protein [Fulvimarina sp. 2208YS6-2-32]MDY8109681.1 hypothetical protein [Fulvimarina sp. 2208YS6-2-32]
MQNNKFWLMLMASSLILAPATLAQAQTASDQPAETGASETGDAASSATADEDASSGAESAPEDDDDDDDDDDTGSSAMVPPASELNMAPGSEMMPASALNGDQIGLPPISLSTQIITPLTIGSDEDPFAVSANDFVLRAGQPYRWNIVSDGNVEYKWHAPDFFRNVWNNQLVINDLEIHMDGSPAWLEYDAKGTISVQFQTIRPGRYDWYVEGLDDEERNMKGTITVVP